MLKLGLVHGHVTLNDYKKGTHSFSNSLRISILGIMNDYIKAYERNAQFY